MAGIDRELPSYPGGIKVPSPRFENSQVERRPRRLADQAGALRDELTLPRSTLDVEAVTGLVSDDPPLPASTLEEDYADVRIRSYWNHGQ